MKTHAAKERQPTRAQAAASRQSASTYYRRAPVSAPVQAALAGAAASPALAAQHALQRFVDASPRQTAQAAQLARLQGQPLQRAQDEDEQQLKPESDALQRDPLEEEGPLQGKFETAQRVKEEEPIQGLFGATPVQRAEEQAKPNNTGLPDNLKSGIESLSGISMDNVQVHYNSAQPAQLNARAYAQGTDIHLAPGQEKHLPHEAWHVVQQAQGRVRPTLQMKGGVPVNDDNGLEHEADVMGAKSIQLVHPRLMDPSTMTSRRQEKKKVMRGIVQRKNLEQTHWIGGLEPEPHTRHVVGDGRDVNVYKDSNIIKATSKQEAFVKLAERNAEVGKTVDDNVKRDWNIKRSNEKWTGKGASLDDENATTIDPFFFEGIADYSEDPEIVVTPKGEEKIPGKVQYLGFMFQHAKSYTGYVEAILDTANQSASGVPSMYDKSTEKGKMGAEENGRYLKYSNVHAKTKEQNILAMTAAGGAEDNLDAYTKIVGEGARWQCIRNNADKIQDDSIIYTSEPGEKEKKGIKKNKQVTLDKPGIKFKDLWITWASEFEKAYDIEDEKVKKKLQRKQGWFTGPNKRKLKLVDAEHPEKKDIEV